MTSSSFCELLAIVKFLQVEKDPQLNTAGVNFFAQNLDLKFSYWACPVRPPTHLINDILKHILVVPVNMLLHIPVWKS